jgi:PAS domain S-box-containing protein
MHMYMGELYLMNLGNYEVEFNRDIIIVSETNENGEIIYINEDFCKISGYSKKELIGKPHNIVRHDFMPMSTFNDLWTTIKKG